MKRLVPVALGAGLLIAISGCDAVQEVQQTADQVGNAASTAQVCVEALRIASGFNPDTANPQAAAEKAQNAGDELAALAEKAGNTTVNQAIDDLATTMRETTVSDLTSGPADWIKQKADQVSALTRACAP
jgi:hypothetical protein